MRGGSRPRLRWASCACQGKHSCAMLRCEWGKQGFPHSHLNIRLRAACSHSTEHLHNN